ncbi:retroviral-like aspartic protease family protein [Methylophaga sp. OBS3]|nr:retroviral-like aspartic protease family protein [Methylophaga sp. OBS3]
MTVIFWLLLMGSLTLFFNGFIAKRDKHLASSNLGAETEVVLQRNRAGHYVAPGFINGHEVTFLLDTGATTISVPASVAEQAELQQGRPITVGTANGTITVYQTRLHQVSLGGITLQDISANINPHMHDDVVLLGMSFMKHLEMAQREGTLTLRVPSLY